MRPVAHVAKYYGTIAQLTINRSLEEPMHPAAVRAHAEPPD